MNKRIYSTDSDEGEGVTKVIYDEPVVCRATATLPSKFLFLKPARNGKSRKGGIGVYARKTIPNRTLFGPLEGSLVDDDGARNARKLHYLVEMDDSFRRLDTSNEYLSNWMRYVKPAKSGEEQNLSLHQQGNNLYFTTTRPISAKEELKVWYSSSYAAARNIGPVFEPADNTQTNVKDDWSMDCDDYQPLLTDLRPDTCTWSCTRCHMKFDNATLLNFHMLTHAADNIETNELAHLTNEDVNFPEIDISAGTHFDVRIDGETSPIGFPDVETTKANDKKTFECPMCNEVFVRLASLKLHVHGHAKDGVYPCPTCSKEFGSYKHIRNHIRIYHSVRRFECDVCSKRFPTQNKLKHHKLCHTGHKPYLCSECGKQFKRRDKLNTHIKKTHEEGPSSLRRKRRKPLRKKRQFISASDEASIEAVYKCPVSCPGVFKRRGMLVNHLVKFHPEVRPDTVPELILPIIKTSKDYSCQYCDKVYKSTSKRKHHILKIHPGKELPPTERESKLSGNLDVATASPDESPIQEPVCYVTTPHPCEWCRREYTTRAKLLQHQRRKHLDLMPKSLQEPKKPVTIREGFEDVDDIVRVDEGALLLQTTLEDSLSEYEFHLTDSKLCGDGGFIIDAHSLRKVLKGDAIASECSPESLADLGQILDLRHDQYFRILQTSTGLAFTRPVEVWDPCQPLSPEPTTNDHLLA